MKVEGTRYACALLAALLACMSPPATVRAELNLLADIVLDPDALLMPTGATYGRAINGVAFQAESLLTYNGYQYATWYHDSGSEEDVYIARRNLGGSAWEVLDTGKNFDNGDADGPGTPWDAHDVTTLGVSGDGRLHFSWDHHNDTLRYMNTIPGVATNPGSTAWDSSIFNAERSALNAGGSAIGDVTYPQFTTHPPTGDVVMNFRTGSSGNGNVFMATYNMNTGLWNAHHRIIDGTTPIPYDDAFGDPSNERNAYINGFDIDPTGRIHVTWTWRETATGGSNHDIMYAYSDDGGYTWKNNAGTNLGDVMTLNSPGIIVVPMDRGNTLMNQQTQAVDQDGRVHMVMWYLKDGQPKVNGFTAAPAAYYHHFRDPATGVWTRTELPTSRAVGSRPDMAYDADGNLYVAYVSPGPGDGQGVLNYYTEGDLIIATASKASAYSDWSVVYTDTRDFSGEPKIDQKRLTQNGIISLIMQENDDAVSGRTGTPLHVLEFNRLAKHLVWAGDGTSTWDTGVGTDWDSDGNNTGDAAFAGGNRVTFDDGAASSAVNVANLVAPSSMTFKNTTAKSYTLTGAAIGGTGGLSITGGGMVTLANAGNSYTGSTNITSGKLALTGTATISASPTINIGAGGTLDVTGTTSGGLTLNSQILVIDGDVDGNVVATNNSTVHVNSTNSMNGNLTVQSGSLATGSGEIAGNLVAADGIVRVGGVGIPSEIVPIMIDSFNTNGLGEYTQTRINDGTISETNVSFSDSSGGLVAAYAGSTNQVEQVVLLRSDSTLGVGETLLVDVSMPATTSQMDFGLAISATGTPTAASGADTDTRNTFEWASVSARPSGNEIRVNKSVNGTVTTTQGTIGSTDETTVSQLFVERTSTTGFVVGYIDNNSVRHDSSPAITFTGGNVGAAIGFYADLRANGGSLGAFDNLRIFDPDNVVHFGQTLTVEGDYTQSAGATLELDIFDLSTFDLLDVGGNLAAGGTLSVALVAGAPTPQAGNEFDLLDFESLSGVFDSVVLPALGPGLMWDNSLLLTSGVLKVAAGLAGDYNANGQVDAADYVVWRKLVGQVGAGLLADGNSDLRVDDSDYVLWKANFGATLSGSGASVAAGAVPEPSAAVLGAVLICCAILFRRVARP